MLTCDTYLRPKTLDVAFDALEEHAGSCRIVAGATDILPWAREGRAGDVHIPVLVDVTAIPELTARSVEGGRVRLGAATPFQRFLDDRQLVAALPGMARCAVWFADDQIRESATLGGNVVNASPAGDGLPPLLVFDASCEVAGRRDGQIVRRSFRLADFVLGPGHTALDPGELLVSFDCQALPGWGGAFEKVGHRRSLVISVVCVAAAVKFDAAAGTVADVRLAVGGIGPKPERLADIEAMLRGARLDEELVEEAAELAVPRVQSRSRQVYRREVVRGFIARALVNAARDAGADIAALAPALEADYA